MKNIRKTRTMFATGNLNRARSAKVSLLIAVLLMAIVFGFTACEEIKEMTLKGNISISPNSGIITVGQKLTAVYTGSEDISYGWYNNSDNGVGEGTTFTPTEAGRYYVAVVAEGFFPKFSDKVDVVTIVAAAESVKTTTIESYAHGGTGTLSASTTDHTITVTGSVTGATNGLALNIPYGVTVKWQASLTGNVQRQTSGGGGDFFVVTQKGILIDLSGYGTLEITSGTISNSASEWDDEFCIYISGGSPTLKISGGNINHGGYETIYIVRGSPEIYISGGTVQGIRSGQNATPLIDISSGTITSTTSPIMLYGGGEIVVWGSPTITAGGGYKKIVRGNTATIKGYYTATTKALFDHENWIDGVNLLPTTS